MKLKNKQKNSGKRFQECNKLEKLWRYRYYLYIPFLFLYHTLIKKLVIHIDKFENGKIVPTGEVSYITGNILWSILIGDAQHKMKWYYEYYEIKDKFGRLK